MPGQLQHSEGSLGVGYIGARFQLLSYQLTAADCANRTVVASLPAGLNCCDALRCPGPHACYTDAYSEYFPAPKGSR